MGSFPVMSVPPVALLRHPLGWLATGFGSGLLPKAPGTAGSLVALALWLAFLQASPSITLQAVAVVLAIGPCVLAADWAARRLGRKDPGCVVSDELAGQWLALLAAPPAWPWWLAAFVLFRIFDIAKPWPMPALERLPGGLGIVLDDLAAGAYAAVLLLLAARFL
ncbi:MAG: phosphatidylglycerophosphatase A [Xanthomonadales bacterium]|nr:phosphatidylglycerophosphatase A [Xanthomonadales bacterium]